MLSAHDAPNATLMPASLWTRLQPVDKFIHSLLYMLDDIFNLLIFFSTSSKPRAYLNHWCALLQLTMKWESVYFCSELCDWALSMEIVCRFALSQAQSDCPLENFVVIGDCFTTTFTLDWLKINFLDILCVTINWGSLCSNAGRCCSHLEITYLDV